MEADFSMINCLVIADFDMLKLKVGANINRLVFFHKKYQKKPSGKVPEGSFDGCTTQAKIQAIVSSILQPPLVHHFEFSKNKAPVASG